ncbi:MAG: hypothetical protein AVDCRST_MAG06-1096, partial [uncultured Nocardioides sp.]
WRAWPSWNGATPRARRPGCRRAPARTRRWRPSSSAGTGSAAGPGDGPRRARRSHYT